jgi:hypothetical protein
VGFLTLAAPTSGPTLFHKMSWTETIDTEIIGLYSRHLLFMGKHLELRTGKQGVFLCLALGANRGCGIRSISCKRSDPSLLQVVFKAREVLQGEGVDSMVDASDACVRRFRKLSSLV